MKDVATTRAQRLAWTSTPSAADSEHRERFSHRGNATSLSGSLCS